MMMEVAERKTTADNGKYVRYTPEQVEALERLYNDCPKPTLARRQQLIRDCPILSGIETNHIKVWFQNHRCREKQRKESSRLQAVNRKLSAMNKLLMEENDRLQKQLSQIVCQSGNFRQQTQNVAGFAASVISCESAVTSGGQLEQPARDVSPAGLLSVAEATLAEFLSKAIGTAVEWVQMPGMKPGPDSMGIISISHNCAGVAARACGLVGLEPVKVAEILKDRASWFHDCRSVDVVNVLPAGTSGTIELLYMQLYAPTTLASASDFWLIRYTTVLEDGSLVICERSLDSTQDGLSMPTVRPFVRAEMLVSGYLIRPCDSGGSVIHIVEHIDFESWSVPEVLRPLYESSAIFAQKTTITALRHLRQIAHEVSQSAVSGWGKQPVALRSLSQRVRRGFNEAFNGFVDKGWSTISSNSMDGIKITINSTPNVMLGLNLGIANGLPSINNAVLCAKASMLLQNVSPAMLVRFLREHRLEWAYSNSATAVNASLDTLSRSNIGGFGAQVIPLAHTLENEEFLEILKLENVGHDEDVLMSRDQFLLQLCNGVSENAVGTCAELIFTPIDVSFADDAPVLPSGFRIIPLDSLMDPSTPNPTLDLASSLEVGPTESNITCNSGTSGCRKSVMTMAFQFAFASHLQENVIRMACQYIRNIISSVQRIALTILPSRVSSHGSLHSGTGSAEAVTLTRWICRSYRFHYGIDLLKPTNEGSESLLRLLWHHSDGIICCSLKAMPACIFANQAGLDMLETTLVALQDITLDKIFDEQEQKILCTELPRIMQQGSSYLQGGFCVSSMGKTVSFERAVAWKVLNDDGGAHCICFMFVNWSLV